MSRQEQIFSNSFRPRHFACESNRANVGGLIMDKLDEHAKSEILTFPQVVGVGYGFKEVSL